MRSLIILSIIVLTVSVLPAQSDISLDMPGYRVAISGSLASPGGIVVAQLDSLSRDRRNARFGLLFPSSDQAAVLELHDGVSGAVLATVSAAQWQGRESAGWKRLPSRSSASAGRLEEQFSLEQGRVSATIVRTLERISAPHLPLGTGLRVTIGVANVSVPSVRVSLRGFLEGSAVLNGQMVTIVSTEKQVPMNATLMLMWSEGTSVRVEGAARSRSLSVRSAPVTAPGEASISAIAVTVAGTTALLSEHQSAQVSALIGLLKGQPARPLLVARTAVDHPKASPGDTVQYRITYDNIGTAPATEVDLSNPVPQGTRFLEGSASGTESEIAEDREAVEPPAVGRVVQLTWKFKGAIAPGESRTASFKVIVL